MTGIVFHITFALTSSYAVLALSCVVHSGEQETRPENGATFARFPLAPPSSPRPAVESAAIVGGTKASEAIQKRHAFLEMHFRSEDKRRICGGSIISRRHILTAAHCLINATTGNVTDMIYIYVGDSNRAASDPLQASRVFVHRDYRLVSVNGVDVYSDDVAVIALTERISSRDVEIMELELGGDEDGGLSRPGSLVYGVGFGLTSFDEQQPSDVLLQVKLRVRAFQRCKSAEPDEFQPYLNKTVSICATDPGFPDKGGRDTCSGDSGGALYAVRGEGDLERIVQIGMTSWGSTGCAGAGTVAWYTRLQRYTGDILALTKRRGAPPDAIWKRYRLKSPSL